MRLRLILALAILAAALPLASRSQNYPGGFQVTGGIHAAPWGVQGISSDGRKIYLSTFKDSILGSPPGYYHVSSDAGVTWTTQQGMGNRLWVNGCVSSDGTTIYAADQGSVSGFIYKSTDSGVTWAQTGSPQLAWQQVSCSNDGTKLVACVGSQSAQADIYTSADGGTTWVDQTTALSRNYLSCVISGDGTKIATSNWLGKGANGDGCVYVSTNWQSGSPSWSENICAANGSSFATLRYSRNSLTLYAAFNANGNTSHVFKTINDGSSWTDVNPPDTGSTTRNWIVVACSSDGSVVIAGNVSLLYVSNNGGVSWGTAQSTSPNGPSGNSVLSQGSSFAVSDNGLVIVNAVYVGFIYVSTDGGNTWRMTSATP